MCFVSLTLLFDNVADAETHAERAVRIAQQASALKEGQAASKVRFYTFFLLKISSGR